MNNEKHKRKYSEKGDGLNSASLEKNNFLSFLNKLIKNLQEEELELEEAFNKKDFRSFELIKIKIQKIQKTLSENMRKI